MHTPHHRHPSPRGWWLLASLAVSAAWAQPAPATRWVQGSGVNLRASPSTSAPVLRRLALSAEVQLRETLPEGGFCKVVVEDTAGPVEGYTACRYLATTRITLQALGDPLLADGKPNPAFDPVKAFWVAPHWSGLMGYATRLSRTQLAGEARTQFDRPRPPDAELDRMKAHLARGIYGPRPVPYEPWPVLERGAAAPAVWPQVLLQGPAFEGPIGQYRAETLLRGIALPAIRPSLFMKYTDVAPPGEAAIGFSGRFNIIHTYRTQSRRIDRFGAAADGLWDIGAVTVALTRPVVRTTLYREGPGRSASTHALASAPVYGEMDEPPMCHDYVYGFGFGDNDVPMDGKYLEPAEIERLRTTPPSEKRLMQLITPVALPAPARLLASRRIPLERDKTGFVGATQFHFDLNADGVPDLVVWEGVGQGPGHLDGPTKGDEPYHRIAFINIAGKWHLYVVDSFGYGCGC